MTIDINEFENGVYEHLTLSLLDHYRARLAAKHGEASLARRWDGEARTRLDRDLVVTLLQPVYGPEARRRVFDATSAYVRGHDLALRNAMTRHVAEELGLYVLTHAIADADAASFWRHVASVVDSVDLDTSGAPPEHELERAPSLFPPMPRSPES